MTGRVIVITSGKGGVGKTTTSANIGTALAKAGYKVVLIDTDLGLRNLDLLLGLENRIVYTIVDVIEERCKLKQALVKDKKNPNLSLLAAAQTRDKTAVNAEQLKEICDTLKEENDFVLVDCPAGIEQGFQNAVAGTGKFTDDCFIKAGEKIQEWVNNGYFPDGVNSLSEDDGQAKQLMYQETAGMLLCGSWYAGTFQTDSEEFYQKIGWFPFPAIDDSDADPTIQIGTVGDQFICFNCEGDKLAAAFECATDHLSDEVADITYSNNKIVPVKDAGDHIKDPVVKEIFDAAQEASSIQLWYDQYLPTSVASAHLDGLQEVFGLTKTPQEAQEEMQTAMDEYLSTKSDSGAADDTAEEATDDAAADDAE